MLKQVKGRKDTVMAFHRRARSHGGEDDNDDDDDDDGGGGDDDDDNFEPVSLKLFYIFRFTNVTLQLLSQKCEKRL
jgi:hypothetical protein